MLAPSTEDLLSGYGDPAESHIGRDSVAVGYGLTRYCDEVIEHLRKIARDHCLGYRTGDLSAFDKKAVFRNSGEITRYSGLAAREAADDYSVLGRGGVSPALIMQGREEHGARSKPVLFET